MLAEILVTVVYLSLALAGMVGVTAMLFKKIAKEESDIAEAMTSEPDEKTNS